MFHHLHTETHERHPLETPAARCNARAESPSWREHCSGVVGDSQPLPLGTRGSRIRLKVEGQPTVRRTPVYHTNARASSWLLMGALVLGAFSDAPRCTSQRDAQSPDAPLSEVQDLTTEVLQDLWHEVVEPSLTEALDQAEAMQSAAEAWSVATLGTPTDAAEALGVAQEAWFDTMRTWQVAELMQIGPAASSLTAIGGQDLRDVVYSWPTVN